MARGGRRYSLVVYTVMINRWWPAVFTLGLALIGLAAALRGRGLESWRWTTLGVLGGLILLNSLVMLTLRRSAYVQLFHNHLRLVTPFLRMNISYKRIRKTSSATMSGLFPPKSVSGWQAGIIGPISKLTAVVVELNAYPISRGMLQLFLSPLFFKDRTPHLVLLVEDWMRFSSELESLRVGGGAAAPSPAEAKRTDASILSRLPHK